ncbi:hypothetical protein JOC36_000904 [Weissella uvarum]|uniref:hypothetical protein n=1 Tax=Weissella uvarum TaxID=1479233 RepID=UPI0019606003|nr:hypothetical protein [Weissella uvarum]MBM7617347.1 hypothetical protein [Weissella uvarum]MCM0595764.1 hypothetical protein [Weissella uvarum]
MTKIALISDIHGYAIIEIDDNGLLNADFKKVPYDIETELKLAQTMHLPYYELYKKLLNEGVSPTQNKSLLADYNACDHYTEAFKQILDQK